MIHKITSLIAVYALGCVFMHAEEKPISEERNQINPSIPIDILNLSLDPKTIDELETESAAWQSLLKDKAEEITSLEIQSIKGEVDKKEAVNKLSLLREQKAAIVHRTEIVLEAFQQKGGDAEIAKKYVASVKELKALNKDIGSRMNSINYWLSSQEGGIKLMNQALKFIGVLVLFWLISYFASKIIRRAIDKQSHISELLKVFINKMSRRVILVIGLIIALGTIGVNVGAALALIGGGAFILAFALQDTLSNFASGMMLIIYRPFDVADAVEIGGITGVVDSVSLVSTTIRTFDNKKVLVPNKKVWGETITNITGMSTRRVDMIFGIGYNDDYEKAQEILERIVAENELILEMPAPSIHLHELADSSVNFICRPWAKIDDYWAVYWDITKRVKKEFDAAGISIPYPQTDVYLHRAEKKP